MTEWQDATGYCYADINATEPEGYWPAMVEISDWQFDSSTLLSDDARTLAGLLTKAADQADARNRAYSSDNPEGEKPGFDAGLSVDGPWETKPQSHGKQARCTCTSTIITEAGYTELSDGDPNCPVHHPEDIEGER